MNLPLAACRANIAEHPGAAQGPNLVAVLDKRALDATANYDW
jgi:hypothetical protein